MATKKKTGKAKKSTEIQIHDGAWYAVNHGGEPYHESCCHCALTHIIDYKIDNGRIWFKYTVDQSKTRQLRKERKIEKHTAALMAAQDINEE